jgi:MFS family permease
MFRRLRETSASYPRQFWLLFWGVLVNSSGASMVWPFLTIYLRQRLDVPLTTIALLLTLNALAGLASTSITGPAVDRFGRKGAMVISLGAGCVFMLALARVDSLGSAALLMLVKGFTDPLYRVGSDAMVADLIPPARRAGAYALLRMIARRNGLTVLSMGMSGDYETAIRFGATHVRVGSALFGARPA